MFDEALAWTVEEACFNAWPSLRQNLNGGWAGRFAPGVSRRANSVNLLRQDYERLDHRIALFERLYRDQGLPPLFRALSFFDPAFEAALSARGYSIEGETRTLLTTAPPQGEPAPGVELTPRPDAAWLSAMQRFHGRTPAQAETYARIVEALTLPAAFAAARTEAGEIAALGYVAVHEGLWCVESVVTGPEFRGQGFSRRMLEALAGWAAGQGAHTGCLQVEAGNASAIRLYSRLGFTRELYRYRYWRAPEG